MLIYPAMDLEGGRVAQRVRGDVADVATWLADPVEAVLGFEAAGAEWVHLADLDGAREGGPRQHGLIVDIALSVSLKLQVAGGFRERDHLRRMFDAGVDRVVVGALAVEDPAATRELIAEFGADHIVLGFDVDTDGPAPRAAGQKRGKTLWRLIALYPTARHILLTDLAAKGEAGPDPRLIAEAARRLPQAEVQASGGICALDQLRALKRAGAAGAVIGPALWEKRIGIGEAIEVARA
jgi:phosphoribosylformimino-5-aminoimidazole carboxamide ribotide isomerase